MDSRYKIPALPKYLKSVRDAGEEDKRGRGKTRAERHTENISKELSRITLTRKAYEDCMRYPYRKPTQVDEERILRRAREVLLRNSAN